MLFYVTLYTKYFTKDVTSVKTLNSAAFLYLASRVIGD